MKLQVIVGTTRPGRVTERLAKWVAAEAKNLPDTEVELIDLADYPMPFLDEPISPQFNPERKANAQAQKWMDKITRADAYVIVTPEYNRSTSAVLKNALDYLDFQMAKKPVALVGHGSSGGAQAVASLRPVLAGLKSFSTSGSVYFISPVQEKIDQDGNLREEIKTQPYGPQFALKNALEELKWYGDALATARAKD